MSAADRVDELRARRAARAADRAAFEERRAHGLRARHGQTRPLRRQGQEHRGTHHSRRTGPREPGTRRRLAPGGRARHQPSPAPERRCTMPWCRAAPRGQTSGRGARAFLWGRTLAGNAGPGTVGPGTVGRCMLGHACRVPPANHAGPRLVRHASPDALSGAALRRALPNRAPSGRRTARRARRCPLGALSVRSAGRGHAQLCDKLSEAARCRALPGREAANCWTMSGWRARARATEGPGSCAQRLAEPGSASRALPSILSSHQAAEPHWTKPA